MPPDSGYPTLQCPGEHQLFLAAASCLDLQSAPSFSTLAAEKAFQILSGLSHRTQRDRVKPHGSPEFCYEKAKSGRSSAQPD